MASDTLDIVFSCGLFHFLSVSGVVTNIINILILSKYGLQETTSILLFSLSVSDLLCSIFQPIRKVHCIVAHFDPLLANNIESFTKVYFLYIPDFFVAISILHTTLIAVERLVAVCFPLQMPWIFTTYRVKWLVLFIYLYVIVLMAPTLFLVELYWSVEPITNKTVLLYMYSLFYMSHFDSISQYLYMALPNLLLTFTLCVTIVCSIVIGYKITVRRKSTLTQLSSSVPKQFKEVKVLKMLLTVCVVNCCVSLPTVIIDLFLLYSDTVKLLSNKLFFLLRSCYINLCQLNATINFIIYVFMSSKFASTLNQVFLCVNKKQKK